MIILHRNTTQFMNFYYVRKIKVIKNFISTIHSEKRKTSMTPLTDNKNVPANMDFGKMTVWPWSLSGLESTIVVKGDSFKIAFDMGYATDESVNCQHVFISHGHIDHIAGIVHHASKRQLFKMKPPTYYTPPHLVDNIKILFSTYSKLQEDPNMFKQVKVEPMEPGSQVQLPGSVVVKAFPTVHRVISQGYIVSSQKKTLKPQFKGMGDLQIKELLRSKIDINDETEIPLVAYTGDTKIEVFKEPPVDDLLKVKLLITESTYIDDEISIKDQSTAIDRARFRGHMHLQEIVDNARIFDNIEHILLVHFSTKYSTGYIRDMVNKTVSTEPELQKKLYLALQKKANSPL